MHSPQPRVTAGSAVDLESRNDSAIAVLAIAGIATHLFLRFVFRVPTLAQFIPLYISLILGGVPLVFRLIRKVLLREFGSDLLAGLSIVVAVLMGQYLVGTIVVLMLSGGTALENFATRRASSVLEALASRMPQTAHRKTGSGITDIEVAEIAVGDALVVFPHEICPVDGMVLEGQGRMNEAYLTGEPFEMSKTPGSEVLSGTINGETALTIRAGKLAMDSRYAKIMQVMQETQQRRPRLRRLGDMLGAWYTPLAITLALVAWIVSGESHRFLAVLVIATPCPLLLAIPVAVIGAISLSARHSIIIKNPAVLEQIGQCATLIFDKTGTLTYGRPAVTEILCASGRSEQDILRIAASLERYSKHPLASAILEAASRANITLDAVTEVSEKQGEGLRGTRRLAVAARAFPREWLGLQLPALAHAAGGANEAIRPPQLCQMPSTGDLIRKSTVKAGPGHRSIMLPAASHVNIIGTSAPPSTEFYAHSVYWLCHRNQREEPSCRHILPSWTTNILKSLGAKMAEVTRSPRIPIS